MTDGKRGSDETRGGKKKNETKEADIKRKRRSDESERGISDRGLINLQPGVNHSGQLPGWASFYAKLLK